MIVVEAGASAPQPGELVVVERLVNRPIRFARKALRQQ